MSAPSAAPSVATGTAEPVLLGVRHHGPGSARAVRRALAAYRPDVVLIEGPPEADALTALAAAEGMQPPVALLAYRADAKAGGGRRTATFWPFADFSPEWQAIQWAVANGVPVRFCDLPASVRYGRRSTKDETRAAPGRPGRGTRGARRARVAGRPVAPRPAAPRPDRACSPRRPATTTRSGGGRTWSSTSCRGWATASWPRRWRRSRRSPPPWPRYGRPRPRCRRGSRRSRTGGRPTCAPCCGPPASSTSGWPWSAAPGTSRR